MKFIVLLKIAPFLLLILSIASGPVLYEKFWHKHYPKIAFALAFIVCGCYMFLGYNHKIIHALMEYIQFISILLALYIASSGIHVELKIHNTPFVNSIYLFLGAALSNLIGTTGASMLLIRPFLAINKNRISKYHIVFFIFIVSNVGGSLTPIGDPPLLLGFMKGVPFFWTLVNNFPAWISAVLLLIFVFYAIDSYSFRKIAHHDEIKPFLQISGKRNFIWLIVIIAVIFLDPAIVKFIPVLKIGIHSFSVIRELILLVISIISFKLSNKTALSKNNFTLAPIEEIAILFVGIFFTMMPVIDLVSVYFQSNVGKKFITPNSLYWTTGFLSAFLDNAPTYINFLAASMSSLGLDLQSSSDVVAFAGGFLDKISVSFLKSISISSVFFGAITYIGNGPNLMVKAIAEQFHVKTPSFFEYILKFSLAILLPILFVIWGFYIRKQIL